MTVQGVIKAIPTWIQQGDNCGLDKFGVEYAACIISENVAPYKIIGDCSLNVEVYQMINNNIPKIFNNGSITSTIFNGISGNVYTLKTNYGTLRLGFQNYINHIYCRKTLFITINNTLFHIYGAWNTPFQIQSDNRLTALALFLFVETQGKYFLKFLKKNKKGTECQLCEVNDPENIVNFNTPNNDDEIKEKIDEYKNKYGI